MYDFGNNPNNAANLCHVWQGEEMSDYHDKLVQDALDAINIMFSDTSVDADQTRRDLQLLVDEIIILSDSLGEE